MRFEKIDGGHVPVPDGWTAKVTRSPGKTSVELAGTMPDTADRRRYTAKILLDVTDGYIGHRCKVSVRQERPKPVYDGATDQWTYSGTWYKAGYGGVRETGRILRALLAGRLV